MRRAYLKKVRVPGEHTDQTCTSWSNNAESKVAVDTQKKKKRKDSQTKGVKITQSLPRASSPDTTMNRLLDSAHDGKLTNSRLPIQASAAIKTKLYHFPQKR